MPSESDIDIDCFPVVWMVWNHYLKQRKWIVNPEMDMAWCTVEVDNKLQ